MKTVYARYVFENAHNFHNFCTAIKQSNGRYVQYFLFNEDLLKNSRHQITEKPQKFTSRELPFKVEFNLEIPGEAWESDWGVGGHISEYDVLMNIDMDSVKISLDNLTIKELTNYMQPENADFFMKRFIMTGEAKGLENLDDIIGSWTEDLAQISRELGKVLETTDVNTADEIREKLEEIDGYLNLTTPENREINIGDASAKIQEMENFLENFLAQPKHQTMEQPLETDTDTEEMSEYTSSDEMTDEVEEEGETPYRRNKTDSF